jgi:hypothetical protein
MSSILTKNVMHFDVIIVRNAIVGSISTWGKAGVHADENAKSHIVHFDV